MKSIPIYKPDHHNDLLRQCKENLGNQQKKAEWEKHRHMEEYRRKKEDLDVSCENEPYIQLDPAQASSENMLLNDPGYSDWLDKLDETPF